MNKLLHLLMTVIFSVTMLLPGWVLAADVPVLSNNQKLDRVETMLYGGKQEGSLIKRMDAIENDVFGIATGDPVLDRIGRMYDYLTGVPGNGEASFLTKLNVVEWRLKESMSTDSVKSRIEATETMVCGAVSDGALAVRLENLLKQTAYAEGVVPVQTVTMPKDSLLKIQFTEEFGSRKNKVGDNIRFQAAENFFVGDVLVIPKGASGLGKIKKIRKPSAFGRDARLDIEFLYVQAVDGTKIPVYVGPLAEQEAKTVAAGVGASVGGIIILGPVGVVGGAFVKGKQVLIKAGSLSVVQTVKDVELQGAIYQG